MGDIEELASWWYKEHKSFLGRYLDEIDPWWYN
jgi:hypothetical protein